MQTIWKDVYNKNFRSFVEDKASPYTWPERKYHNVDHIERMFELADIMLYEFDSELAIAILYHDIVYDAKGSNEWRSTEYFINMDNLFYIDNPNVDIDFAKRYETSEYIMRTKEHRLNELDNRIVILDLYDLSDDDIRPRNFEKIIAESKMLYPDKTDKEIVQGNIDFMKGLYQRFIIAGDAIDYNNHSEEEFGTICYIKNGILKQIVEAKEMLNELDTVNGE